MVEQVVQHAVGLEARLWPVLRVKVRGRGFHGRHVIHLGTIGSGPVLRYKLILLVLSTS
jgi:hypothetical protein